VYTDHWDKCEFQEYPAYHFIRYNSGEKGINIKTIDSIDFVKFEESKTFKYSYYNK